MEQKMAKSERSLHGRGSCIEIPSKCDSRPTALTKGSRKGPKLKCSAFVSYLQQEQLAPILTSLAIGEWAAGYIFTFRIC
jgi:hypothetical protein